ncbi:hypothetical protein ABID59_001164 [Bradyrhizobium sp. S3.3.6]|uniref:hypothetical protein n=1 Tax=Bradyrhizobium sp. S3.3.6 TaxID=3156429 RepID=UPI003390FDF6
MAQQLHHSPYDMFVIALMANMKFLPIMKTGVRAAAARVILRSPMRNRAGKSRRDAVRRYFCGNRTIPDFGCDRAWLDGQ